MTKMDNEQILFLERLLATSPMTTSSLECHHSEVINENNKCICMDCGEMLVEHFISDKSYSSMMNIKKRHKTECSIYNEIPAFFPQSVKNATIDIYKTITQTRIFRNTTKKAIILASLHRASEMAGSHQSFNDLLDIFSLKQHEANRGFTLMYTNLPKDSHVLFFDMMKEVESDIMSKLKHLGMLKDDGQSFDTPLFNMVMNTFRLVKDKAHTVDEFQQTSIICGCIYFWALHLNLFKREDHFAERLKISKMTLLRAYIVVCEVVYKSIMRSFLANLFQSIVPTKDRKYRKTLHNELYNPTHDVLVHEPMSEDKLTITNAARNFTFPLDEVDNLMEWNVFLKNARYYSSHHMYLIRVFLVKEINNTIRFNFNLFNDTQPNIKGEDLLKALLMRRFEPKV